MMRMAESAAGVIFRSENSPRSRRWAVAIPAIVLAATALAVLRAGESIGAIYAEDGEVFYRDERAQGYLHVLLTGYAGYLHLVPRTITWVAASLPLRDLGFGLSGGSALVTGLVAGLTARAVAAYGVGRWGAAALALLVPLAPIGLYECLDAACNIQWFLAVGCFWALIWAPVERRWLAASCVLVFVTIGSAPLTLVFLPIAIFRLIMLRGVQRSVAVAYLLGAVLQIYTMFHSNRTGITHPQTLLDLLKTTAVRLFVVTWLGVTDSANAYTHLGSTTTLLVGAFWLLLILCCSLTTGSRWLLAVTIVMGTALFLAGTLNNYASTTIPGAGGHQVNIVDNGRYSNSPSVILAIGAICALLLASRRSKLVLPVLALAVVALSVTVVRDFRYPDARQTGPTWRTSLAKAEQTCAATPTAPDTTLAIAPAGYSIHLSCPEVLSAR